MDRGTTHRKTFGATPPVSGRVMVVAVLAMLLSACGWEEADTAPLATVPKVDLDRYVGRWYEIARLPNRFQNQCVSDTTATYTRNDDGTVAVLNRCRVGDGKFIEARALARVAEPRTRAKLEVSFFSVFGWRPVWGDYWVLALGPDYEYAVVGEPGREYGWILSRTPTLPAPTRAELDERLRALGYQPERFANSTHTAAP